MSKETLTFKTEIKELLDLMIHSLYSNREVFLRELLSNAADAIDRVRFESLTQKDLIEGDDQWKIRIVRDEKAGTVTVSDNGIGMDRAGVEDLLGTIAKSGTRKFLDALKASGAQERPGLIGQFGVGFYSSFMVAGRVTVLSRKAGDPKKGVHWESTGDGTYTVEEIEKAVRGTDVVLHLKEDAKEFLEEHTLRSIVRKFSDFVEHPIVMPVEKGKGKVEDETLNSQKALWLRPRAEITDKDYNEFFKHAFRDFTDPAKVIHYSAEGQSEFKALLFFPAKAPLSFMEPEHKIQLHLYVRRVFIMEDCKKLLPEYLRFVRGVVDSADLPLNVSREILQESKELERIEKSLVNKVLSTLKEWKEKEFDKYAGFFREFGKVIKEGVHLDHNNREAIQELLLYPSTLAGSEAPVSLKTYADRMREGQKDIFYLLAESVDDAKASPFLEKLKAKGYEVLFMTDPIDEWVMQSMHEFKGKKFRAVHKGEVTLAEEDEAKSFKEDEKKFQWFLGYLKEKLKAEVDDVRLSQRLTDSACCLVASEHAPGAHMEKIFRAMNREMPLGKPVLEVNPRHAFVRNLLAVYEKDKNHPKLEEYAGALYDQALLLEGKRLRDPAAFARRVNQFLEAETKALAG